MWLQSTLPQSLLHLIYSQHHRRHRAPRKNHLHAWRSKETESDSPPAACVYFSYWRRSSQDSHLPWLACPPPPSHTPPTVPLMLQWAKEADRLPTPPGVQLNPCRASFLFSHNSIYLKNCLFFLKKTNKNFCLWWAINFMNVLTPRFFCLNTKFSCFVNNQRWTKTYYLCIKKKFMISCLIKPPSPVLSY